MANKIVSVDPDVARIIEEMRAREEAERSAPPPDDENDTETALQNINALVDLAKAYATADEHAARAAKARMSPRTRWECEYREAHPRSSGTGNNDPDSD
jgi:hypothetical protein